ncbi:MAG: preQ(1) synthase [Nitrospinota bacterium]
MSRRSVNPRTPKRRATNPPARTVAPRVSTEPTTELETFPNPAAERDYEIAFDCPEFTCLCPLTGQPDFATIRIRYVPDERCVELKSLKLYLWSYRDVGTFHEAVTNRILDDLVGAVEPRRMTVVGDFYVRGGIKTTVTATYGSDDA